MRPMELLTTPAARAAFTSGQLSYALEDYVANGPSLDCGNGRAAAIYEFPEGLLTIVEEGRQLALCTQKMSLGCAQVQMPRRGVSGEELG